MEWLLAADPVDPVEERRRAALVVVAVAVVVVLAVVVVVVGNVGGCLERRLPLDLRADVREAVVAVAGFVVEVGVDAALVVVVAVAVAKMFKAGSVAASGKVVVIIMPAGSNVDKTSMASSK